MKWIRLGIVSLLIFSSLVSAELPGLARDRRVAWDLQKVLLDGVELGLASGATEAEQNEMVVELLSSEEFRRLVHEYLASDAEFEPALSLVGLDEPWNGDSKLLRATLDERIRALEVSARAELRRRHWVTRLVFHFYRWIRGEGRRPLVDLEKFLSLTPSKRRNWVRAGVKRLGITSLRNQIIALVRDLDFSQSRLVQTLGDPRLGVPTEGRLAEMTLRNLPKYVSRLSPYRKLRLIREVYSLPVGATRAQRFTRALGVIGVSWVKLIGQWMGDNASDELRTELNIWKRGFGLSGDQTRDRKKIELALGRSIKDAFEGGLLELIDGGTAARIYKGRLKHRGKAQWVSIKVVREGYLAAIESEMGDLMELVEYDFERAGLEKAKASLLKEADLRAEADAIDRAQSLRDLDRGIDVIRRVQGVDVTRDVLFTHWVEGIPLSEYAAMDGETLQLAYRRELTLFERWLRMFAGTGELNGDPHLGNQLFDLRSKVLTLIDFGNHAQLSMELRVLYGRLAAAVVLDQPAQVVQLLEPYATAERLERGWQVRFETQIRGVFAKTRSVTSRFAGVYENAIDYGITIPDAVGETQRGIDMFLKKSIPLLEQELSQRGLRLVATSGEELPSKGKVFLRAFSGAAKDQFRHRVKGVLSRAKGYCAGLLGGEE